MHARLHGNRGRLARLHGRGGSRNRPSGPGKRGDIRDTRAGVSTSLQARLQEPKGLLHFQRLAKHVCFAASAHGSTGWYHARLGCSPCASAKQLAGNSLSQR